MSDTSSLTPAASTASGVGGEGLGLLRLQHVVASSHGPNPLAHPPRGEKTHLQVGVTWSRNLNMDVLAMGGLASPQRFAPGRRRGRLRDPPASTPPAVPSSPPLCVSVFAKPRLCRCPVLHLSQAAACLPRRTGLCRTCCIRLGSSPPAR